MPLFQRSQEVAACAAKNRMDDIRGYLAEWNEDKDAKVETRMGDDEARFIDNELFVEKDIHIQRPSLSFPFGRAAQLTLNTKQDLQKLPRFPLSGDRAHTVEKISAPHRNWFSLIDRRDRLNANIVPLRQ
jgi:hypothetical protein